MKRIIRYLFKRYCKPVDVLAFFEPPILMDQLTPEEEMVFYNECKMIVEAGAVRKMAEIYVGRKEHDIIYDLDNRVIKISAAELERAKITALAEFISDIESFAIESQHEEVEFNKFDIT